jgi:opacity protein-like surface antigen
MKRFLTSLAAVSAAAAAAVAVAAAPAAADYGRGALYQVEITANEGGPNGGGIWLWIELTPTTGSSTSGTGDYAGSDCGHGHGAAPDRGDVTWSASNGTLTITGVVLNGFGPLGPVPVTISVPSGYGHYAYPTNAFTSIFAGLPPFLTGGKAQVQIAP